MDRFIDLSNKIKYCTNRDLKSNMDRFIDENSYNFILNVSGFKIQYG